MFNQSISLQQYLVQGNRPDLFLVEITTPAGTSYFHSGLGVFEYGGNDYLGTGSLGKIEIDGNVAEVAETQVKFTLSGIDEEITDMLDNTVKPGSATITQVFLRPDWTVDQSVLIEECTLEKMELTVGDGSAAITLYGKGGFHEINSRSSAHWDPQNQRQKLTALGEDPDSDTGFDLMHTMRDKLIVSAAE